MRPVIDSSELSQLTFPTLLLKNYLHFLSRRPISGSNVHFKAGRISSLQSLAPLLAGAANPDIARAAQVLHTLTPGNLTRLAPEILRALQKQTEPQLPRGIIASTGAPDAAFFKGVRRALLVLGQGIGIGDEILTFPLAGSLRRMMQPESELTVLSSYRDLWQDVEGVDRQAMYGGLSELVEAVRSGGFDLVAMVDFERPGLLSTLCSEPGLDRYIELAMGLRQLAIVDKPRGRMWQLPQPDPYFANFYQHMERMQLWLGDKNPILRGADGRVAGRKTAQELVIYVSPFTSKEDPSERYWGELLVKMLPPDLRDGERIRILVDSGANYSTRAFATGLVHAVQGAGNAGVCCEAASTFGLGGSLLSLSDAMRRIGQADIVVTADSFPAHAGQLFQKLTLVLARDGVENWRAPAGGNFYMRAAQPLGEISLQIRAILNDLAGIGKRGEMPFLRETEPFRSLAAAADRLRAASMCECAHGSADEVRALWNKCRELTRAAVECAPDWPPGYDVLLVDHDYAELLPELAPCASDTDLKSLDARLHLLCRFAEWENSNLVKYARWTAAEGGA
jgi:hypothetical protein